MFQVPFLWAPYETPHLVSLFFHTLVAGWGRIQLGFTSTGKCHQVSSSAESLPYYSGASGTGTPNRENPAWGSCTTTVPLPNIWALSRILSSRSGLGLPYMSTPDILMNSTNFGKAEPATFIWNSADAESG
ncbi:hypothetical protein [Methanosarcina sp. 2.H.T.1A.15]|uniref:hypothetical protein n=1 Tax=Methanosarcina sp. 2.H.T.1A.15 TaxID=1483596 RepID=UPI0012DFEE1D|nr:hypothetical protein [Methanosarcina sp. 2.H.T.1A.15]